MKAAVVTAPNTTPIVIDFPIPTAAEGEVLIHVRASALSHLAKGRASGSHYSSTDAFPFVAGVDGVGLTPDGRRVYFVLPEAPNGALAEFCSVDARRTIELPDTLDDITAAAIANPGMSAWAALVERAHIAPGETVLINGATGTAGRMAVQLAKHLGAGKIIATGRNAAELEALRPIGADLTVPFNLASPTGAADYEAVLKPAVAAGIDIVIDYLWGSSAVTLLMAIAKNTEDGHPTRFVQIGAVSQQTIELPAAVLRASAIQLMGSGIGSVPRRKLLEAIQGVFHAVAPAGITIDTRTVPLADLATVWDDPSAKPRIVITIP